MSTLSEAELARIAKNREKAKNLKASKLCYHPYARSANNETDNKTETANKG